MKAILTTPLDWREWIRFTDCVLGVGLVSTAMEQGALGCGGQLQAVHQTTREDGGVGKGGRRGKSRTQHSDVVDGRNAVHAYRVTSLRCDA